MYKCGNICICLRTDISLTWKKWQILSKLWPKNLKLRNHLGDLGKGERLILTFQSLAVSLRTTKFNIQKFYMVLALRRVFFWISEQTATFALYIVNWMVLVFITVVGSVYCAVWNDSLYRADCVSSLKG